MVHLYAKWLKHLFFFFGEKNFRGGKAGFSGSGPEHFIKINEYFTVRIINYPLKN